MRFFTILPLVALLNLYCADVMRFKKLFTCLQYLRPLFAAIVHLSLQCAVIGFLNSTVTFSQTGVLLVTLYFDLDLHI